MSSSGSSSMRAGDTRRRTATQQQPAVFPTASAPDSNAAIRRRRPKREATSPIFILTVVMVGTCLIFVVTSRIFRSTRKEKLAIPNATNLQAQIIDEQQQQQQRQQQSAKKNTPKFEMKDLEIDTEILVDSALEDVVEHTDDDREPEQNYVEPGEAVADVAVTTTIAPTQSPEKVLALLYPPGLMGGYRNQVIRLLSLVVTAIKRDVHALLLPSLLWTTQIWLHGESGEEKETWVPIPHDLIFDVEHWNTFTDVLPRLVEETTTATSANDGGCWTHDLPPTPSNATALMKAVLSRGFLAPLANLSHSLVTRSYSTNLRKLDAYPNVSHCTAPQVFGGGNGAGRLWRDYINRQTRNQSFQGADAAILRALRPKKEWRELAQQCVSSHTKQAYIALHARMELEMMDHACGRSMERNLTRLFDHVETLVETTMEQIGGVFVAVSRSGIDMKEGNLYDKYKVYADENLDTLNRVVGDRTGETAGEGLGSNVVVFECGKHLMDKYYTERAAYYAEAEDTMDYGSLLQSVVNFYIATEAKAFIGVRGSSYSTDIWTTRYHQGNGETNYEYTKDGIIKLGNAGLPPMHTNCGTKKK